jgi:hypothetical protein
VRINLNTKEVDVRRVGSLDPTSVLFEADGPRLFTSQDADSRPLLVYLCGESMDGTDYFVVPTSAATVEGLQDGRLNVRQALGQSWGWLVSTTPDGNPTRAQVASLEDLPQAATPTSGVSLYAERMPLLTIKLTGTNLQAGRVSASVVRTAADKSIKALKKLAHTALEATSIGRPEEKIRRIYDLPVQSVRFASFEIAFGSPLPPDQLAHGEPSDKQVVGAVSTMLKSGLRWLKGDDEAPYERPTSLPVLEALAQLVPPAYGPIERVELSGSLLSRTVPYVLTRKNSASVRKALAAVAPARVAVKVHGLVREFDKDQSSFTLRNVSDGVERHCSVEGDAADVALEAFDIDATVEVVGYELPGTSDIDVLTVAIITPDYNLPSLK